MAFLVALIFCTCGRFGAQTGVIGVHSRSLSIPSSAIGSQHSIRRRSFVAGSIECARHGAHP